MSSGHNEAAADQSGQNGAVGRTETVQPLTTDEFNHLQEQMGQEGIQMGTNTFNHLLDEGAGPSTVSDSWLLQTNHFHEGSEIAAGRGTVQRTDTLERNPGFINPSELTEPKPGPSQATAPQHVVVEGGPIKTEHKFVVINDGQVVFEVANENPAPEEPNPNLPETSPTCANPSDHRFEGTYGFYYEISKNSNHARNKYWEYSTGLRKLFIDIDKYVQIAFHIKEDQINNIDGLFIRALPVYSYATQVTRVVERCPNHCAPKDYSNRNFPREHIHHLIRTSTEACDYQKDPITGRLSVVVPFMHPQAGTTYCTHLYKFMCLNSDVGGINRRPVKVIFTLEDGNGRVVGRDWLDLRICVCPRRDCAQETKKMEEAKGLATGLARSTSILAKPSAKKRRTEVEEFVMVPVAKADFQKINEMAEATVLIRNPDQANQIKDQRRKLLEAHNKKYLNNK